MANERSEETYEPPTLTVLGSVEELTLDQPDSVTISDQVLKERIQPVESGLRRLCALQMR